MSENYTEEAASERRISVDDDRIMDPWMNGNLCWQHLPQRPSKEKRSKQ